MRMRTAGIFIPLLAMLVLWCFFKTPLAFDHGLLFQYSEILFNKGRYVKDFIDISPPLHIAYYYPAYLIHDTFSISIENSLKIFFFIYVLFSMYMLECVTRESSVPNITLYFGLALALLFVSEPRYIMAKDVMSLLLMLPWIASFILNINPKIYVSVLAALGLIAKPHFLLIWIFITSYNVYVAGGIRREVVRSFPFLFVGFTYISVVYVYTPSFYIYFIELLDFYDNEKSLKLLFQMAFAYSGLYLLVLCIPFYSIKNLGINKRFYVLLFSFLFVGITQKMGLIYHFFPMSLLCIAYLFFTCFEQYKGRLLSIALFCAVIALSLYKSIGAVERSLHFKELYESIELSVKDNEGYWTRLSCKVGFLEKLAFEESMYITPLVHSPWMICPYFSKPSDEKADLFINLILKSYERGQLNYIFSIKNDEGYDNPYAKEVVSELERLGFIDSSKVLDAGDSNVEILYLK